MRAGTRKGARWLAGVWAVTVVLPAVVMAGPAQASASPFTYSSVAWTGTAAIVAGTDSNGDLYFFSEGFLTRKFYGQLVASGQHFIGAPAIAVTGTTISIAVSQGNQVDDWSESGGTGSWHEQVVAAAQGTFYGPAAIGFTGRRVIIAAVDTHNITSTLNYLDYWYEPVGTTTWHEQLVSTGLYGPWYNTAFGPSIGFTGRHVIIASIDRIGELQYFYEDAGATRWHKQLVQAIGGLPFFADPSMAWTGSEIVITARVQGAGVLDYWYEPAGTATWHEQVVTQNNIYAPPAITGTGNSVFITATDEHGNLEYWSQEGNSGTWNNQQVAAAPGVTGFANPSIALAHGAVIITAVERSNGSLDYWAGPGPWSEQQVAAG